MEGERGSTELWDAEAHSLPRFFGGRVSAGEVRDGVLEKWRVELFQFEDGNFGGIC